MSTFNTTGNLFADYLIYSDGKSNYNLDRNSKDNVDAFIDLFDKPFLFCDDIEQQQIVEIRAPVYCWGKPGLSLIWESAPVSIADGRFYLHHGQMLKYSLNSEKMLPYAVPWSTYEQLNRFYHSFSISIATVTLKYIIHVMWRENSIEKHGFEWHRISNEFLLFE